VEEIKIKYEGNILNGLKELRQELEITDRNQLHSNIRRGIQEPLDAVLASHIGWGQRHKPFQPKPE
jgi:hypothetical protein